MEIGATGWRLTVLPVPGPFAGGALGAVAAGGFAVVAGGLVGVVVAPPVAGPVEVARPLPVPGPFGPAVAVVPVVGVAPTGAGPLATPEITVVGWFAFVLFPLGSSVDGMVSTLITGFATWVGVPWIGADTSLTPPGSGGGFDGSLGPGAVDSPITGPTTRGWLAWCAQAPPNTRTAARS